MVVYKVVSMSDPPTELELTRLDLAQLALFVGMAADHWVLERLTRAGFESLRSSHGFIVQHLIGAPRSASELAGLLSISQQAVSKSLSELRRSGYIEGVPSEDARVRRVRLSKRGRALLATSRALRMRLQAKLTRTAGVRQMADAQALLLVALEQLGGSEAVKKRRVRPSS